MNRIETLMSEIEYLVNPDEPYLINWLKFKNDVELLIVKLLEEQRKLFADVQKDIFKAIIKECQESLHRIEEEKYG